ncbi:hypothetical protein RQP46_010160 [Phenoliferia psychrophenolica]
MTVKTIYLARHGFRLSWAKELAKWFAALPEKERPQAIISSPLYRCLQTATPAAEALGLPIVCEHGISEWYLPVKRGLHPRSLPATRLTEWFPLIQPSTPDISMLYPTQKGETILEIHQRAKEALSLIIDKLDREGEVETVVLFTHAATNIAMGRGLVGDFERSIQSGTCSVGKYVRRGEGGLGEWDQVMNGDCSMLERGEERHWEFSYVVEYEEDGILEDGTDAPLASDKYIAPPPPSGKL